MPLFARIQFAIFPFLVALFFKEAPSFAQNTSETDSEPKTNFVLNGSFEEGGKDGGSLAPWSGQTGSLDIGESTDGKASLLVDTRESDVSKGSFHTFNQSVDPAPMRGKRIRFSASVKTADRSDGGQAMLWVRVDRKDSNGTIVPAGFDNMQDRPIKSDEWGRHEIVVEVAKDAIAIHCGMIVLGKAKAWLDDARMEIVGADTRLSGASLNGDNSSKTSVYSHWMWLALFALILMFLSQTRNSAVQRFALKFTFAYWLFYIFHSIVLEILVAFVSLIRKLFEIGNESLQGLMSWLSEGVSSGTRSIASFVATHILGVELPPPMMTGSGDTLSDWVRVLSCFLLALFVAMVWSLVWRSDKDKGRLRDLLRIGLRYSLALTLLEYGLHKAGFISTQFLPAGMDQELRFDQRFGDFSPMGLLWSFMRASNMYTFFAGLLEVVPAILLVFRRTSTFGAIAAIGVMANVFLLNMCYDVPVKQYSFHLMIMGCLILAPEMPRIMNLLFWNRTTEPSTSFQQQFFHSKPGIWSYRIAKTAVVLLMLAIPIGSHAYNEVTHDHTPKKESEFLLLNRGFRWIAEFPYNR